MSKRLKSTVVSLIVALAVAASIGTGDVTSATAPATNDEAAGELDQGTGLFWE